VLGDVYDSVKGKPQILDVLLVHISIKHNSIEVASLEKARIHLLRHAHMEVGGVDLDVNDIPF
jgi:hypothetical protein